MKQLVLWFVKLTGALPQLLYLKRKTYYADRRAQGRRIKGAALIVSNHTSLLDYVTMLFLFFGRTLHVLAAEVLYKSRLMRWFLDCLGCLRVDRKSADMSFIAPAVELLKQGKVVGIFPESYLVRDKGIQAFKPSFVYIALKSGAPIIPVYCAGRYGLFKRAKIVVGERMYLGDYCTDAEPSPETLEHLAGIVRARIADLSVTMAARDTTKAGQRFLLRWFPYDQLRVLFWPIGKILFPTKYYYADGRKPTRRIHGGAVIIANHVSLWDPPIIAHAFTSRRVFFMAAETLYEKNRFLTWFMNIIGSIRVNRGAALDLESFNHARTVLKAGGVVCVFPEGQLSRANRLLPFKPGMVLMAAMSGTPIIPVYKAEVPQPFHRLHMIIGRPIDPRAYLVNGQLSAQAAERLSGLLYADMLALKATLESKMGESGITDIQTAEVST
jgi:1-acyl-sn-glycerol-3-phosphate acyltransferase